ncbi:hypothetical protein [Kordia jejudonensis]|uniref:hypothetical protein n=1 Tax=Kordia jejudonensis TaxID=1348245 RepID=UPI0006299436|nr:hypothetical protein [Kordia jejudonensis]
MKKRIRNNIDLELAILELKTQKAIDYEALKSQMALSYEQLRPVNVVKRVYSDLKDEPKIKNNVLESVISIAVGYISKRVLIGKSNSFMKSMLGYLVQIGATKIVSNTITTDKK